MSEQNNIDDIFRLPIEGMSLKPPLPNLDGVRANVLQKSLHSSQIQNQWLKGIVAMMTLLLGGSLYLLQKKTAPNFEQTTLEKIVKVYKRDTIYVTKLQPYYIKIPVMMVKNIENTSDNSQKNKADLKVHSTNEINLPNNILTDNFSNDIAKNQENTNLKNTLNPDKQVSETKQATISELNPSRAILNNESGNIMDNQPLKLTYNFLKAKPYQSDIIWKKPSLKYKSPVKISLKAPKIKIPFMDRLTAGVYIVAENNIEDVRKDAIQAFGLGDESVSGSSTTGLRIGLKLSKKVSIVTGIEKQRINFIHEGNTREPISAISGLKDEPVFLRYSIFGVAQIPIAQMTANPKIGSSILVEGDDGHYIESIRIPLSIKYTFYEQNLRGFGWRGAGLNFYLLGGSYYAIPTKQQIALEVYEPNGNEYHTSLTNFNNVNDYTGLNFGLGAELTYGRSFQFYVEPFYSTTLKSLVNNMPIRTFINSTGVRFGINYQFSKK
ncbi:MAG: hypothetical protein V4585_19850 [Bacteroidota bacterium]